MHTRILFAVATFVAAVLSFVFGGAEGLALATAAPIVNPRSLLPADFLNKVKDSFKNQLGKNWQTKEGLFTFIPSRNEDGTIKTQTSKKKFASGDFKGCHSTNLLGSAFYLGAKDCKEQPLLVGTDSLELGLSQLERYGMIYVNVTTKKGRCYAEIIEAENWHDALNDFVNENKPETETENAPEPNIGG